MKVEDFSFGREAGVTPVSLEQDSAVSPPPMPASEEDALLDAYSRAVVRG